MRTPESTNSQTPNPGGIPAPVHADQRPQPLPGAEPKPVDEDARAQQRLEAILSSPTYRQSDRDDDFLARPDVRGVRLQIDYLKPELILQEQGVEHTIVVFGSTRIREAATSRRRVEGIRRELDNIPGDVELEGTLAIAERLSAKSDYYAEARALGRLVGASGEGPSDNRVVLVTGGGPGMMEAANRGAFDVGAKTAGLNITLPHEQFPNPYITPELAFRFHYFALRKLHFLLRAKALVAFPGGFGTFDELFEALTLIQTRTITPMPVVLVGRDYWRRAFDVDFLVDEGVIAPEDRDLFWYAATASEVWRSILAWHEANGTPLFATD